MPRKNEVAKEEVKSCLVAYNDKGDMDVTYTGLWSRIDLERAYRRMLKALIVQHVEYRETNRTKEKSDGE